MRTRILGPTCGKKHVNEYAVVHLYTVDIIFIAIIVTQRHTSFKTDVLMRCVPS